jgi:hypothetical protein
LRLIKPNEFAGLGLIELKLCATTIAQVSTDPEKPCNFKMIRRFQDAISLTGRWRFDVLLALAAFRRGSRDRIQDMRAGPARFALAQRPPTATGRCRC